jgi:sporulation protein YlmC with PRC-barrel domain
MEPVGQAQSRPLLPSTLGEVWLASRLLNRQVVNVRTLEPVGRVADVLFDPESSRLTALAIVEAAAADGVQESVRRAFRVGRAQGRVGIEHIIALNGDVVMVDHDPARLASPRVAQERRLTDVRDTAILTLHGMSLGSLSDVLLDHSGYTVTAYVVKPSRQAKAILWVLDVPSEPSFEQSEPPAQEPPVSGGESSDGVAISQPPAARLWAIPASPGVRFGDALIVVVDIEHQPDEAVIVPRQPVDDVSAAQRTERAPRPRPAQPPEH